MAYSTNSILQHAYSRLNKDQSGNVYGPDQFNIDLPYFMWEFINKRYGLPTNIAPGLKTPAFGAGVSQNMTDDLSPLVVTMGGENPTDPGVLTVDANGWAELPEDYYHYLAINGFQTSGDCNSGLLPDMEICNDQQFSSYLSNSLRNEFVSKEPYCVFQNGGISVRPKDIAMLRFSYLKKPETPFFDYYIVVATLEVVYLPPGTVFTASASQKYRTGAVAGTFTSQSVELPFADYLSGDFSNMIVDLMSENLRSPFMKQVSAGREAKDA